MSPPPAAIGQTPVRRGCYLLSFVLQAENNLIYDGTLRVEGADGAASGDLYQRATSPPAGATGVSLAPAPASDGIPIFSRSLYRAYLRVTHIAQVADGSFNLNFDYWRPLPLSRWSKDAEYNAHMVRKGADSGGFESYSGDVKNVDGSRVGTLTMTWVSPHFRRASIQISRGADSEAPTKNGSGLSWQDVFAECEWEISSVSSEVLANEPSGAYWSDAELHAAMLELRGKIDLDSEWRFHVLAVRRLASTDRGIMYDSGATDSNNVPREGVGISSHWIIPNEDSWGLAKGLRVGSVADVYFRTAVHEIGHAMGLYHNSIDNGFMATTDRIAERGTGDTPFPKNIRWSFASDDVRRLKHYPDLYLRPGGAPFGDASDTPFRPLVTDDTLSAPNLVLNASALLDVVPFGSPVRVAIELKNKGSAPIAVPPLHMKAGHVRGRVIDAGGISRAFRPLVLCIEEEKLEMLAPGEARNNSLTLLRGGEGALFPTSGLYRIEVELTWVLNGFPVIALSETSVYVMPPIDETQALLAKQLLLTPDVHVTLVLGGDHLADGIRAIGAALGNQILRPHYGYVEAHRLMEGFRSRKPNFAAVSKIIDDLTVMSPAEILKTADAIKLKSASDEDDAPARQIAEVLKRKIEKQAVPPNIRESVDRL